MLAEKEEDAEDNKIKNSKTSKTILTISVNDLDRQTLVTRQQEERLERIQQKDKEIDRMTANIGKEVDELHQKARIINHDITNHANEIEKLGDKMDDRLDEVTGLAKRTVYVNNKVHS
jgi:chromosome segregation ATPase